MTWSLAVEEQFYLVLPLVIRRLRREAVPVLAVACLAIPPVLRGLLQGVGTHAPFVLLPCRFRGQTGYYCSHVLHNGPAGIAAGREIYGTPKLFATVAVARSGRAMTTEASLGGTPVLRVSSVTDAEVPAAELPALAPSWRLKLIPRADGPGPALKQLIDCSGALRDPSVHFAGRGSGTVRFGASPELDLTPLGPIACRGAFYFEMSYAEHYAAIAYDFLAERPNPS